MATWRAILNRRIISSRRRQADPVRGRPGHVAVELTRRKGYRHGEALEALRRAAEIEPEVAFVQNNLGMALELNGQAEEAVEAYRLAVALDPAHEKASANLVRIEPTVPETEAVIADATSSDPVQ